MTGKTVSGGLSGFIHHNFLANVIGIPSRHPGRLRLRRLPIGMQVLGRPFDEATILRIGDAYQSITDWQASHPLQFEVAR